MKQIRLKNAEGKTYVFPACSDEEVDLKFTTIRMEIDPELVPVLTTIHPLKIGLWSADLLTLVAEMEIKEK